MQREIIDLTVPDHCVKGGIIDLTGERMDCAICLEEVGSNGPPLWLGCHVFCRNCIHAWGSSCPTCRREIPVELRGPRRSARASKPTMMFTTNGSVASAVPAHEMVQRVEEIHS